MPVPTSITDLSTTPGSNFPQSTDSCGSTLAELPRNVSAIIKKQFVSGSDVTAANGILTLPCDYSLVKITGAGVTITGFSDCFNGRIIAIRFDGINTLTHSASFDLPTGANITTAANDVATFVNVSSGVWQCVSYEKAMLANAIKGHAFSAYLPSADQLIPSATATKISLSAEEFDTENAFDSSVNFRFSPSKSGYYYITLNITVTGTDVLAIVGSIKKNGVNVKVAAQQIALHAPPSYINISSLIYMNGTTDYLEAFGQVNATANSAFVSGAENTFFQGFLART